MSQLDLLNSIQDSKLQLKGLAEAFKLNFKEFVKLLDYRDTGKFHEKAIENISKVRIVGKTSRRLWLWARGHFKTSLITEAHAVWLIVNNPNMRILIVSNTLDIAKSMFKNIKAHFMFNDDFRSFFKEFCPIAKEGRIDFGTTEQFTVPNRTKNLKEPTVMCAGIGTNLTGLHFDYMKIDDLVTKGSITNDTQLQASKDYYASLRPLFDNPTVPCEDVTGTIYHFHDLYSAKVGGLMTNPEFQVSFIAEPYPDPENEDKIVFPERFSLEGLSKMLDDPTFGPYDYASQMMLNPRNPKDAKLLEEWLKYYEEIPSGLAEYICVDPASTQKKKSDFTVLERWGVDSKENHYLLEGVRDKLTVFQRVDRLFDMVSHSKNLKWVKYEVLGGRHGDIETIKHRQREEKKYFPIRETKATTATKADRIEQRLVGHWHAGVIYLPHSLPYKSLYDGKAHDFITEYKLEYLQFPFTEHDDILDCHSQMFEEPLMRGKKETRIKDEEDKEFMWLRQQAINARKPNRSRYVFGKKKIGIPAKESWR